MPRGRRRRHRDLHGRGRPDHRPYAPRRHLPGDASAWSACRTRLVQVIAASPSSWAKRRRAHRQPDRRRHRAHPRRRAREGPEVRPDAHRGRHGRPARHRLERRNHRSRTRSTRAARPRRSPSPASTAAMRGSACSPRRRGRARCSRRSRAWSITNGRLGRHPDRRGRRDLGVLPDQRRAHGAPRRRSLCGAHAIPGEGGRVPGGPGRRREPARRRGAAPAGRSRRLEEPRGRRGERRRRERPDGDERDRPDEGRGRLPREPRALRGRREGARASRAERVRRARRRRGEPAGAHHRGREQAGALGTLVAGAGGATSAASKSSSLYTKYGMSAWSGGGRGDSSLILDTGTTSRPVA
jgi:hypothetical protein